MRDGILSGEGAAREVAAFMLDSKRVHGVPETFFAELYHPYFEKQAMGSQSISSQKAQNILPLSVTQEKTGVKYGSLQFLKENNGESCDYSYRKFSVADIQSIAALDMRILNCDRNDGNILVKETNEDTYKIIPIDHGLSLPDNLSICDYELCWSLWPQVEQPINEKLYNYLINLDTKSNALLLKKYLKIRPVRALLPQICLRNYRIAETTLIQSVKAGLTLFEISKIFYRLDPEGPESVLQNMVKKAEEIYEIVKNSVCRNLYSELSLIHQKVYQKNDPLSKSAVIGKDSDDSNIKAKDPIQDFIGDIEYQGSPLFKREKTLFLKNSELNVKGVLGSRVRDHSPESAGRKRAQSCFESDLEYGGDDLGTIRLEPLAVDSHDKPMEVQSFSFKKNESETRDETPPKQLTQPKIFHTTSPGLRRTISNPLIRKPTSEQRLTVEDSSTRTKFKKQDGNLY